LKVRLQQAAPLWGGLWLALLLTACAATPHTDALIAAGVTPPQLELTGTPFHPQNSYQCGPAALATVLNASGIQVTPETLAPSVYLPKKRGTLQAELMAGALRHGRIPYVIQPTLSNLIQELQANRPVLVLQNLGLSWMPQWHYAVVIGYDFGKEVFILRSGTLRRHLTTFRTFEHTWGRSGNWGMVLLKPGELPVHATAENYLKEVAGLERAGWIKEARAAYEAALEQWPRNLIALIGFGNTAYALHDLAAAEHALRQAVQYHPANPVAHNNLAQVLLQQGKQKEALRFARRAVELGGGNNSPYQATLNEVQREIVTTSPTDSNQR
jgi:hypothetical protein